MKRGSIEVLFIALHGNLIYLFLVTYVAFTVSFHYHFVKLIHDFLYTFIWHRWFENFYTFFYLLHWHLRFYVTFLLLLQSQCLVITVQKFWHVFHLFIRLRVCLGLSLYLGSGGVHQRIKWSAVSSCFFWRIENYFDMQDDFFKTLKGVF